MFFFLENTAGRRKGRHSFISIIKMQILFARAFIILTACAGSVFFSSYNKAIEHSFCVYTASSEHEEGWENSRELCKPLTTHNF